MIRRFVFDPQQDRVVEIQCNERQAPDARERYENALGEYSENRQGKGAALKQAALDRAERREFAHKKFGDERRWRE